jgi:hypothetical protein
MVVPNHVINELVFRGVDAGQQQAIVSAACDSQGKVDFGILVPMPLNIWMGSVGSEHERAFQNTGLDWARVNWGTKWNAYSHKPTEVEDEMLTLRFETAWAPPYPWLAAMLNKLSLSFQHNWLDEGAARGRTGTFKLDERWGPIWDEDEASDAMHRHLHKLHWGVEEFAEDEA